MDRFYDAYRYDYRDNNDRRTHWEYEDNVKEQLSRINITDAHYATCGIPVISDGKQAYVHGDDSHGLIMGSTGSKKTRLFVQPMMHMIAKAGESVICTDPKGELYDRTSGIFAQEGYNIQVFNLRDPLRSCGWNPLYTARKLIKQDMISKANTRIDDLAQSVIPDRPNAKVDPFWASSTRDMFRLFCHIVADGMDLIQDHEVSFALFPALFDNMTGGDDVIRDGLTNELIPHYPKWSLVHTFYNNLKHGTSKTFENVLISYASELSYLFSNHSLLRMFSLADLDFCTLGREKTVLYIIMPDEKTTYHRLVSLLIKNCYEDLIDTAQNCEGYRLPVRVNFLLDEFCNLPAIPDMNAMISAARSRNIRFYLVVQSLHQLVDKYGSNADSIRGNCGDWAFLTSREYNLLQEISNLCGERDAGGNPLITVSQLQRLDKRKGEALMLCGRLYPYITRLADIDDYAFKRYPAIELPDLQERRQFSAPHDPMISSSVSWLTDSLDILR